MANVLTTRCIQFTDFISYNRSDEQMFFRNTINTDGFSVDFSFSRKRREKGILEQDLQLEDFCLEEIENFYRPCAVDPGVNTLLTAAYGHGREAHEIRQFSSKEFYSVSGSKQRTCMLNKEKERTGVRLIESSFPSGKTARYLQYLRYCNYFFANREALFGFYCSSRAQTRFQDYQGKQRALEEATNLLINGGKKYDRKRRKKTKRNRRTRKENRKLQKEAKAKKKAER